MFRGTPDILSRQCTAAQRLKNTVLKKQLCRQLAAFTQMIKTSISKKKNTRLPSLMVPFSSVKLTAAAHLTSPWAGAAQEVEQQL